ncbi:MAG TPA: hypothetical protein VNO14_15575 [Blastocatellia bacterium]|nr:hypothetical protein [Blastocatellia bacterium]
MPIRYLLFFGAILLLAAGAARAGGPPAAQSDIDPERSLLESMIKKEQAALSRLAPAERRTALVKAIERNALEVGFEVKVRLAGPKKDTLELNSPVFDKPMIYRAVVKGGSELAGVLRSAGIAKVLVTNGKQSWTFDTRSPDKWLDALSATN